MFGALTTPCFSEADTTLGRRGALGTAGLVGVGFMTLRATRGGAFGVPCTTAGLLTTGEAAGTLLVLGAVRGALGAADLTEGGLIAIATPLAEVGGGLAATCI